MKNFLFILGLALLVSNASAQCPTINFSYNVAPIPCQGKTRISITFVSGGAAPYTYQLNGGIFQTSKTFFVTQSGGYTLTVKDKFGCTASKSIATVVVIPKLNATVTKTNATCNGMPNGTATANPINGIAPYSYQWKQGTNVIGTGQSISSLAAGAYKLVVTDAQNCSKTVSFSISQSGNLSLIQQGLTLATTNPPFLYSVKLFASGGTPPKMFRACDPDGTDCSPWQNGTGVGGSTAFVFVYAGTYQFQVKDANNCIATLNLTVPLPLAPNETEDRSELVEVEPLSKQNQISVFPNPSAGTLTVELPAADDSIERIRVLNMAGRSMWEQAPQSGSTRQLVVTPDLPAGIYFLQVVAEGKNYPLRKFVKQ